MSAAGGGPIPSIVLGAPPAGAVVNREGPCSARGALHAEPPPEQDLVSGELGYLLKFE